MPSIISLLCSLAVLYMKFRTAKIRVFVIMKSKSGKDFCLCRFYLSLFFTYIGLIPINKYRGHGSKCTCTQYPRKPWSI